MRPATAHSKGLFLGVGLLAVTALTIGTRSHAADAKPTPPQSRVAAAEASNDMASAPFDEASRRQFHASLAPEDLAHVLELPSRSVLPTPGASVAFQATQAKVYLQFREALSRADERRLERQGLSLYAALGKNTYLARVFDRTLEDLRAEGALRGVAQVEAADKLDASLYAGRVHPRVVTEDGRVATYVWFYDDVTLDHARFVLRKLEVEDQATGAERMLYNNKLQLDLSFEDALVLAGDPTVERIRAIPAPGKNANANAQLSTGVSTLQNAGLTGIGVNVGVWENGGVEAGHMDFGGRVTVVESGSSSPDDAMHATHVSGTILGDGTSDPSAEGMAPGLASLVHYDNAGDTITEQADAYTLHGVRVTNHSWTVVSGIENGAPSGFDSFGAYDGLAMDVDTLVHLSHMIVVQAAGNDGADCLAPNDCDGVLGADGDWYNNIPSQGNAKNVITVGAIDGAGNIQGFSSRGPTDDGRIKPDVVAPGANLMSSTPGDTYGSLSGTSMSSAVATGAISLLVEHHEALAGTRPNAETVRALLVASAIDGGRPGPDHEYGYGMLDVAGAKAILDDHATRLRTSSIAAGTQDTYTVEVAEGTPELEVVLAWTDPAGQADSPAADLVNDLDLELVSPGGTVTYPFSAPSDPASATSLATATGPNTRDNLEQAVVQGPVAGTWTVRVLSGGLQAGPQDYTVTTTSPLTSSSTSNDELFVSGDGDFGTVCPFTETTKTIRLFNTSFLHTITIKDFSALSAYELSAPPTEFPINAGQFIDIQVSLQSSTVSPPSETLTITWKLGLFGSDQTTDIPLSAFVGVNSRLVQAEAEGEFENVLNGDNEIRTVYYTNTGTCSVLVEPFLQSCNVPCEFSLDLVDPVQSSLIPVPPGETLPIPVTYTPIDFGPDTAQLRILTYVDCEVCLGGEIFTDIVNLSGRSAPPVVLVPDELDFGTVCPGDILTLDLVISNTGFNAFTIKNVVVQPNDLVSEAFRLETSLVGTTVAGGSSVVLPVSFIPSSIGNTLYEVVIVTDVPEEKQALNGQEYRVDLRGVGGAATWTVTPEGSADGTTMDYGNVLIGDIRTLEIDVASQGDCPLEIRVLQPPTDAEFELGPGYDDWTVVPAGDTLRLPITYRPVDSVPDPDVIILDIRQVGGFAPPPGPGTDLITLLADSPPPIVEVPSAIDFGEVCIGDSVDMDIDVCNVGFNHLGVQNVSIVPTSAYRIINNPFPDSEVSHDFCLPIRVRFEPQLGLPNTAELTFSTNDPNQPNVTIPLIGAVPEDAFSLISEANGDFDQVLIGDIRTLEFDLINEGDCELEVSVSALPATPEFEVDPFAAVTLQAGETLRVPVTYRPADFGPDADLLSLVVTSGSDPVGSPIHIPLAGDSPAPDIAVTGSTDFENTCIGEILEKEFSICNVGFNTLDVQLVEIVQPCPDFQLVQSPFPAPVSHDFCLPVTIRYQPTTSGRHDCILRIVTDDPDEPEVLVDLRGFSDTPRLRTTLESGGNFFNVKIGQFETLKYFIFNDGGCPLTVFSLTQPVTSSEDEFSIGEQQGGNPTFPVVIPPGDSYCIFFRYAPEDFGPDASVWRLETDARNVPVRQFQLMGRSMPPDIRITGSTDFGTVCPDEQAELVFNICNVGFNDLGVRLVEFIAPCDDFTLINSPYGAPISKDFCLPITIRYTPQTTGEHECILRIESDDPDQPIIDVPVTGRTPEVFLDIPGDICFPATVIESVQPECESSVPFPITNHGECNVVITDIAIQGVDADDWRFENLPALPLILQPGHRLGNGNLTLVFDPNNIARFLNAEVVVTYVDHDPMIGDSETVVSQLAGEGVSRGGRLTVLQGGVPVPNVDKCSLYKVINPDTPGQTLANVEVATDVNLQVVPDNGPCPGYIYHCEWGGESNPYPDLFDQPLPPGRYFTQVAIQGSPGHSGLYFEIDECGFIPDLVIDIPE